MARIIQPGADYKEYPQAWAGVDIVPRFIATPLISLHLFGTDFPLPVDFDYSNNLRKLVRNGVPPSGGDVNENAYSVELGSARNYRYPLSFTEIGALGGGEFTVCAILKTPASGTGFAPFSGLDADVANADYVHVGWDATSTANSPLIRRRYNSVTNNDMNMSDTVTTHRGNKEFFAAVVSQERLDSYRAWPGQSLIQQGKPNTGDAAVAVSGTRYPRIGYIYGAANNAYKGSSQMTMLALYAGTLTGSEVEAVYQSASAYITSLNENYWAS